MERKKLIKYLIESIEFNADYNNSITPIKDVIDFFINAEEKGATHVDWTAQTDYEGDSESCDAQPLMYELESVEDAKIRIDKAKRVKENANNILLKNKRAEYERLKRIFE